MSKQDTGLPQRWGRLWWVVALVMLSLVVGAALKFAGTTKQITPELSATEKGTFPETGKETAGVGRSSDEALITRRDAGGGEIAASSAPVSERKPMVQREPPLTQETEPAASAIATLMPLAESGRADAMNELARRLMGCKNYVDVTESSIRRNVLQRFYSRNGREPAGDEELTQIAGQIEGVTRTAERCRDIDPALMDSRIGWMERAARAGDVGAMLDYPGYALNDMRSYDDVLHNFDEVARRRQLAGELLRGAMDRGACIDALPILADAYSGQKGRYGWLFKPDAYLALVYAEAAAQAGISQERLATARQNLPDPARQAAAAEQGRALMVGKCAGSY